MLLEELLGNGIQRELLIIFKQLTYLTVVLGKLHNFYVQRDLNLNKAENFQNSKMEVVLIYLEMAKKPNLIFLQ